MYARMSTKISIRLSSQQMESLRRGENISICIKAGQAGPSNPSPCPSPSGEGSTPPPAPPRAERGEAPSYLPQTASPLAPLQRERGVPHPQPLPVRRGGKRPGMFLAFMLRQIERLRKNGNVRTSETYQAAMNKLRAFWMGRDVAVTEIDGMMMEDLQAFLRGQGLSMNSISFYMRIVRAVYHRAVEQGLSADRQPFRHVFTGEMTTAKRALSLDELRRIRHLRLSNDEERFARDLFLFSFYTRGMSFIDLAYLRKDDVRDGMMSYTRHKTGHKLTMRWEEAMQRIVNLHPSTTAYLLPIIRTEGEHERSQYRLVQDKVNRELKAIASRAHIRQNLTMYCARHSWATIAREQQVPVSVISHAMGHTNELTTEVYLKAIDSALIDKCNFEMIRLLE